MLDDFDINANIINLFKILITLFNNYLMLSKSWDAIPFLRSFFDTQIRLIPHNVGTVITWLSIY